MIARNLSSLGTQTPADINTGGRPNYMTGPSLPDGRQLLYGEGQENQNATYLGILRILEIYGNPSIFPEAVRKSTASFIIESTTEDPSHPEAASQAIQRTLIGRVPAEAIDRTVHQIVDLIQANTLAPEQYPTNLENSPLAQSFFDIFSGKSVDLATLADQVNEFTDFVISTLRVSDIDKKAKITGLQNAVLRIFGIDFRMSHYDQDDFYKKVVDTAFSR